MEKILKYVLNWLTLGPLRGYRTQLLALALFGLSGARALGWLHTIDEPTFTNLTVALTGAIGLTAASHTPE